MNPAVYKMARRPMPLTVKRRVDFDKIEAPAVPEIVAVDRFTECHVTPPDVAARMARHLGPGGDYLTLEPSAGTGNLTRALLSAGYSARHIVQVERHWKLSQGLPMPEQVVNQCFLEYAAELAGGVKFARIIMNPPFSDVRKHVAAARGLLADGGALVALVPVTFQADGMETLELLPDDTFLTAKVRTKIIRMKKPTPIRAT